MRLARLGLILPLLLLANLVRFSAGPADPGSAARDHAGALPVLKAETVNAGFTFAPSVSPADREAITAAVASARPEAQRLIALVDGFTTVGVGGGEGGTPGTATDLGDRYEVRLDLAMVRPMGPRGISRLVLHELAHVVDYALVTDDLLGELDKGIPDGWVCEEGQVGSCAQDEERFAETFAKWATGDIGVDIYLGYKVPPPSVPLDTWGTPLVGLGA